MKMRNKTSYSCKTQSGAVLVIGLILLVAMTLIGVTAMKLTTLDERIAANTQTRTAVFQAAESILIETVNYDDVLKCSREHCDCLPDPDKHQIDADCKSKNWAKKNEYKTVSGEDAPAVSAVGGMRFERNVNIFGNSIGSGSEVAGRLVRIEAISGGGSPVKAKHNLEVAPVGLRKK